MSNSPRASAMGGWAMRGTGETLSGSAGLGEADELALSVSASLSASGLAAALVCSVLRSGSAALLSSLADGFSSLVGGGVGAAGLGSGRLFFATLPVAGVFLVLFVWGLVGRASSFLLVSLLVSLGAAVVTSLPVELALSVEAASGVF